jgi:hypothetical protein
MMNAANGSSNAEPLSNGEHVATISHDGGFWEVYLEFQNDPRVAASYRGLLCFFPAAGIGTGAVWRTTTILIEASYEEVLRKARAFQDFQLQSLLRSVLPEPD